MLGPALTGQKQTDKPDNATIKALMDSLNQVIKLAALNVSVMRDMRMAAQSITESAADAAIAAKKEEIEREIDNAWASFASAINRALSRTFAGPATKDSQYAEALKNCERVVEHLQGLQAKIAAQQKESSSAARLSSDSLKSISTQMDRIQDEAKKMRDALSDQLKSQTGQGVLRIQIGGLAVIFHMEGSQLTVGSSATSVNPVIVPITNGKISRAALVDALKNGGLFQGGDFSQLIEYYGITRKEVRH